MRDIQPASSHEIADRAGPATPPRHPSAIGISPDAGSGVLQILSTEHWSLLTTRSLTYSESFSRVEIFLSLLSGAVIGLALLAQVETYRQALAIAAILILAVVLAVGLATIARLTTLNNEDLRCVMGMNRLRRAYLELHPELEPFFLAGSHDDLRGVMVTTHMDMAPGRWRAADAAHSFQTMPAMLGVIVAVVAAVLGALVARSLGAPSLIAFAVGAGALLATVVTLGLLTRAAFETFANSIPARFPSESGDAT